ncbi:MAG: hypothetical protein ABIA66_03560 [Candidatus Omnitrophota bacterium]
MGKKIMTLTIAGILFLFSFSFAQDDEPKGRLILRQAEEIDKTTVAVEAYLVEDILELIIYTRMYATKPRIYNAIVVGPKLGRLSSVSRETFYPKAEEIEKPFPTTKVKGGLIFLTKKTENKIAKGTVTKELLKFRIPKEKIMSARRYELRITVESMQEPVIRKSVRFELKDFAGLLKE